MALAFIDPQNLDRLFVERARGSGAPQEPRRHAAGRNLRFAAVLAVVLIAHGAILAVLNIFELARIETNLVHEIPVDLVSAPEAAEKPEAPQSKVPGPDSTPAPETRKDRENPPEGQAKSAETPAKPEPPTPEAAKPEQPKPEQPKAEQPKPEQPKPGQPKPEPPKQDQAKPEPAKPGPPKQRPRKAAALKKEAQKPAQKKAAAKAVELEPVQQSAEAARAQAAEALPRASLERAQALPTPGGMPMRFDLAPDIFRAVAVPQASETGEDLVSYSTLVFSRLELSKQFPEAALARGARGSAGIGFTLDEAGNVLDVELLISSGDPDLDEESVALVRRAAPFPPPPPGARRRFDAVVTFNHN